MGAFVKTKYVDNMTVNAANGQITIAYSNANITQLAANDLTIILTPEIQVAGVYADLTGNPSGNIDWACVSVGVATATARGFKGAAIVAGTVPAKYAPGECK
jgi:type IV pilus assembly protein PilA